MRKRLSSASLDRSPSISADASASSRARVTTDSLCISTRRARFSIRVLIRPVRLRKQPFATPRALKIVAISEQAARLVGSERGLQPGGPLQDRAQNPFPSPRRARRPKHSNSRTMSNASERPSSNIQSYLHHLYLRQLRKTKSSSSEKATTPGRPCP
jgi:hypothetical protein